MSSVDRRPSSRIPPPGAGRRRRTGHRPPVRRQPRYRHDPVPASLPGGSVRGADVRRARVGVVVERDDGAGLVGLGLVAIDDLVIRGRSTPFALLHSLVVHPDARRQGVAGPSSRGGGQSPRSALGRTRSSSRPSSAATRARSAQPRAGPPRSPSRCPRSPSVSGPRRRRPVAASPRYGPHARDELEAYAAAYAAFHADFDLWSPGGRDGPCRLARRDADPGNTDQRAMGGGRSGGQPARRPRGIRGAPGLHPLRGPPPSVDQHPEHVHADRPEEPVAGAGASQPHVVPARCRSRRAGPLPGDPLGGSPARQRRPRVVRSARTASAHAGDAPLAAQDLVQPGHPHRPSRSVPTIRSKGSSRRRCRSRSRR